MGESRTPGIDGPITVSDANRLARTALETQVGFVAVVGEISNLARPASGHIYFSLKDASAQLRCAFFRQRQRGLDFRPDNGDEVIGFGRISLYEPRGDYQLIVERLQMAGSGALQKKFEQLRARLTAEGLFDPARRREPPPLPRRIGVVTSPSGAAIRDILHVLARRFPAIPVRIIPSAVQGDEAASELVAALDTAAQHAAVDVIILARGGGSLEDLWPFNEEALVRAVAACPVPVIAGIGHETDVTLADLAADVRAPTPSGAAELAVPDWQGFAEQLRRAGRSLNSALRRRLQRFQQRVDVAASRLGAQNPAVTLRLRQARLHNAHLRLGTVLGARLQRARKRLGQLDERLASQSPAQQLARRRTRLAAASVRLPDLAAAALGQTSRRLAVAARALDTVSPLATLGRGYALVTDRASGNLLRSAAAAAPGQALAIRLAEGRLYAVVDRSDEDNT